MWQELMLNVPKILLLWAVFSVTAVAILFVSLHALIRATGWFEKRFESTHLKRVRVNFEENYSQEFCESTWGVRVVAVAQEESRDIVRVFFGDMRPQQFKVFFVDRCSGDIVELVGRECEPFELRHWY